MTSTQHQLAAQKREVFGKQTKKLRNAGQIPANISGKVDQPVAITVDAKTFTKVYDEAGETAVIYVSIDGEKSNRPVLVDEVDYHPMLRVITHASLRQVDLKEKVTATVPVELVGELDINDANPLLIVEELEVEALPTDFPEAFEIDLSQFTEIGQEFTLGQLKIDTSKLTVELPEDTVLLQVQEVEQMAEVVEEAPAEGEAVEGEAATAEGETVATETAEKSE